MEYLGQVLITLALVAPALVAPGPVPAALYQQSVDEIVGTLEDSHMSMVDISPLASTIMPSEAAVLPSSHELRKVKHSGPNDNPCTPGDRICHASLVEILFCNDDRQWVSYSDCQNGTFCHRLHMVCVPEVLPRTFAPRHHGPKRNRAGLNQCKEGDRRCSISFNRVDRCNSNHEWVTYHDCRKAEGCDETLTECLPRITMSGSAMLPTPTSAISPDPIPN